MEIHQMRDNNKYIYGNRAQVDKDIIHQIATNEKINTWNYTEEQIFNMLNKKENKELSIIYDYLETQKNEKLFKEKKEKLKSNYIYIIFIYIII